jgi:hypothetical protein
MIRLITLVLLFSSSVCFSQETCSRTALINFQEVIIDTDSTKKGEGLRFFLEKDEIALNYLEAYQDQARIKWSSAAIGTAGTGLLVAGLFTSSNSDSKRLMYIGGFTLLALNFLIAKTMETNNEQNLINAIEEYNKRNLPRIELLSPNRADSNKILNWGLSIGKTWDF